MNSDVAVFRLFLKGKNRLKIVERIELEVKRQGSLLRQKRYAVRRSAAPARWLPAVFIYRRGRRAYDNAGRKIYEE